MSVQYGEQRPHSWLQYGACSHETLQPGCQATCSIQHILSTLQWWHRRSSASGVGACQCVHCRQEESALKMQNPQPQQVGSNMQSR